MAKTEVIRARVTQAERQALRKLATGPRQESKLLRMLIHEGLKARGLWPPRMVEQQASGQRT